MSRREYVLDMIHQTRERASACLEEAFGVRLDISWVSDFERESENGYRKGVCVKFRFAGGDADSASFYDPISFTVVTDREEDPRGIEDQLAFNADLFDLICRANTALYSFRMLKALADAGAIELSATYAISQSAAHGVQYIPALCVSGVRYAIQDSVFELPLAGFKEDFFIIRGDGTGTAILVGKNAPSRYVPDVHSPTEMDGVEKFEVSRYGVEVGGRDVLVTPVAVMWALLSDFLLPSRIVEALKASSQVSVYKACVPILEDITGVRIPSPTDLFAFVNNEDYRWRS